MKLVEPWPSGYTINTRSPYGWRKKHPITGKRTFHHGVDVALPTGTRLTAPADGVVAHKARTSSAGHNLIIRHEGTRHTVYYHLAKASELAVGDTVQTGDIIAYSGNTGASTGPHLHWELRNSRTWGDTTDPVPYLVTEAPAVPEPVVVEVVEPEPVRPEPMKPAKPAPKWTPSAALQRGFKRLRGAVK